MSEASEAAVDDKSMASGEVRPDELDFVRADSTVELFDATLDLGIPRSRALAPRPSSPLGENKRCGSAEGAQ